MAPVASARDGDGATGAPPSEARDDVKPRQAADAIVVAGALRAAAKANAIVADDEGKIAQVKEGETEITVILDDEKSTFTMSQTDDILAANLQQSSNFRIFLHLGPYSIASYKDGHKG